MFPYKCNWSISLGGTTRPLKAYTPTFQQLKNSLSKIFNIFLKLKIDFLRKFQKIKEIILEHLLKFLDKSTYCDIIKSSNFQMNGICYLGMLLILGKPQQAYRKFFGNFGNMLKTLLHILIKIKNFGRDVKKTSN